MSARNHTQLRHRILAMAEPGVFERHCTNMKNGVWKVRLVKGVIGGPEARGVRDLFIAGALHASPRAGFYWPRPITRTPLGERLLAEWNEQHGEVKL